ncbi:MAG TPA: alpha/beta hydrolase [Roseiflexaceae bacterium]|nr:alpha/beta hydrolase [Roseiflexaceae bacterium]
MILDGPTFHSINGLRLALYERAGAGQPLLFVHANGFHARCWDQVIARLPGRRCFAPDLRGHGRSDKPAPPYDWRVFGQDIAALARALDLRGAVGVGHSLGGHAVALAAALVPEAFGRLLLIDPVIMSPAVYQMPAPTEHFAARRRDRWESPAAMEQRFRERPPFSRWDPAVLRDYCQHGLLPAPDGDGFVLACPPAIEAAIYLTGNRTDIYAEIATVDIPVTLMRAGQPARSLDDMTGSPTAPDLAQRFPRGQDIHLPEHTHFIPMEDPPLVAAALAADP